MRAPGPRASDALRIFRMHALAAARDRHTLAYVVFVPLLVYPLLFAGAAQWLLYRRGVEQKETYRVLLLPEALPAPLEKEVERAKGLVLLRDDPSPGEEAAPVADRARGALEGSRAEVVLAPGEGEGLRLFYDSGSERSQGGRRRVEKALEEGRESARRDAIAARGLDAQAIDILPLRREDVSPPAETGRRILGAILPVLLMLMSVGGAFPLAVDLTAGEKERRTAETTLLLPISPASVFLGKLLAVLAGGGVAAALNLASMVLASRAFLSELGEGAPAPTLPLASAALVLLVCLLFLLGAASLLLAVALFARSQREGQSYVTPLFLLFVLVPALAFQPGRTLDYGTALVPIVNATFALRGALEGSLAPGPFLLALGALAAIGAVSIALASRLHASAGLQLAEEAVPLRRWRDFLGGRP